MTATPTTAIVNAVTNGITALNLGQKRVLVHKRPTNWTPDKCPELAVWCAPDDFQILTGGPLTAAYERTHHLHIVWAVWAPDHADTGGVGTDTIVADLEDTTEAIIDQIAEWACGGIPGLDRMLLPTLETREIGAEGGNVWFALIDFTVEQAA